MVGSFSVWCVKANKLWHKNFISLFAKLKHAATTATPLTTSLEKVTLLHFVLLPHYFNSFNFYTNGELPGYQIGGSGVQVNKENETFTVMCLHSPKNLEFGHSTLLFCTGRQRNVRKFKKHAQSDCLWHKNFISLIDNRELNQPRRQRH